MTQSHYNFLTIYEIERITDTTAEFSKLYHEHKAEARKLLKKLVDDKSQYFQQAVADNAKIIIEENNECGFNGYENFGTPIADEFDMQEYNWIETTLGWTEIGDLATKTWNYWLKELIIEWFSIQVTSAVLGNQTA